MFDLNSIVSGLVEAFDLLKSEDKAVQAEGFKLFGAECNTLKEAVKELADLATVVGDFAPFETRFNEAKELYIDYLAKLNHEEEAAKMAAVFAEAVVSQLTEDVAQAKGTDTKVILSGAGVDVFCTITNYENNREVEARALKQARAVSTGKDTSTHQTGDQVAIVMLDPERNSELWERTERVAKEAGLPHTLPFIKVDGHTRAYGWTHDHYVIKGNQKHSVPMFARPESLFITVYRNQTDGEIYQLVQDYCNGVSKATNGELQQMGMKKIEFSPITAFVGKDSWKTAFRTIDRKWGADTDAAIKEFQDALEMIDNLKIDTKSTTKKLSGVRAALIETYVGCAAMKASKVGKWKSFWLHFFATKTKQVEVLGLIAELSELGTGDAPKARDLCVDTFNEYAGLNPVQEVEEADQEA